MVNKSIRNEPPPANDEAWWAALLAEESKQPQPPGNQGHPPPPPVPAEREKPAERPAPRPVIDWDQAQVLYEQDKTVDLLVTGFNRGGLLVSGEGLQGFVPISHLLKINCQTEEEERNPILTSYVGKQISVKVIECDSERGRVVFSERAALAASGRRNQLFDDMHPGETVCGFVTNITDFGVFVDLGGVEGLIHVSELSWGRVRHPADMVEVGDKLYAIVLHVDKDRSRIALSLKRLNTNPWETAEARYQPGQIVEAVVTSIVPFGAFARLEEGLDGLIHISELTTPGQSGGIIQRLAEGQALKARVLNVDASRQRLGLSLKLNNGMNG
jgi:small subunit ribosomal protein S1